MRLDPKSAPTAAERDAEIEAWKSRPRTESEVCKQKQEEYRALLQARKDGTAPLYHDLRTGRNYP